MSTASATIPTAIPSTLAARLLGLAVNDRQIARLHQKGQFPPIFTMGAHKLVLVADLDAFIAQRKAATTNPAAVDPIKSEQTRRAVNVRWDRVRAEKTAAQSAEAA
jgi:hypothetical protein